MCCNYNAFKILVLCLEILFFCTENINLRGIEKLISESDYIEICPDSCEKLRRRKKSQDRIIELKPFEISKKLQVQKLSTSKRQIVGKKMDAEGFFSLDFYTIEKNITSSIAITTSQKSLLDFVIN